MVDRFKIDGHKLIYHPRRVAAWLEAHSDWERARSIYPIYVEISPVGYCNHRCTFCALDFLGYQQTRLDEAVLCRSLAEMAQRGVKSVMFAGEGEPLLYKPLPEVLERCGALGLDVALTTNFVPARDETIDVMLRRCRWIKVSINGGTAESYAAIHGCAPRDFERVTDNMRAAVERRRALSSHCTLGAQLLLVDDNRDTAAALAALVRDVGFDYIVIKPYSQHPASLTTRYASTDYSKYLDLQLELEALATDEFDVVFRLETMKRAVANEGRYGACGATPFFWAYLKSDGTVWGCSAYLADDRFCYGDLNVSSFHEIWEGERRARSYHHVRDDLDISECRTNCRMDEVNRYLWALVHPSPHVNFI